MEKVKERNRDLQIIAGKMQKQLDSLTEHYSFDARNQYVKSVLIRNIEIDINVRVHGDTLLAGKHLETMKKKPVITLVELMRFCAKPKKLKTGLIDGRSM